MAGQGGGFLLNGHVNKISHFKLGFRGFVLQTEFDKFSRITNTLAIITATIGLLAFVGLVPLSRWQVDEFHTGAIFREQGLSGWWIRVSTWSPRFLSELALYYYQTWVSSTGTPHILKFMSGLWAFFIFISLSPLLFVDKKSFRQVLALCVSLILLCVAGQRNSEVLYWLQAAIAYLPSIAGLLLASVTMLAADMSKKVNNVIVALSLTVAALTSEAGAFMVGAISGLSFAYALFNKIVLRREPFFSLTAFLLPLIATLIVLWFLARGRLGTSAEVFGDPTIAHNLGASLMRTIFIFPRQYFLFGENVLSGRHINLGLLAKIAFFIGSYATFSIIPKYRGAAIIGVIIGLAGVAAALISMGGSIYQFGVHCCARHTTMEQVYIWISIAGFAKSTAATSPMRMNWAARVSGIGLFFSCAIPIIFLTPSLISDYSRYNEIRSNQFQVWHTGKGSGDTIIMQKFEPGKITQGGFTEFPAGEYENIPETGWYQRILMDYFKKDKLLVAPENQR